MDVKPFQNHTQSTTWHFPSNHAVTDTYCNLVITIPGMEMRWNMVVEIHKNDDSIEETDLRHN